MGLTRSWQNWSKAQSSASLFCKPRNLFLVACETLRTLSFGINAAARLHDLHLNNYLIISNSKKVEKDKNLLYHL